MRLFPLLAGTGLLFGQIGQPPEFQDGSVFQTKPTAGALDGTSHVAADRAQLNETLLNLLRGVAGAGEGVKLIERRMLRAAEDLYRREGAALGLGATLFFLGETAASAEVLCEVNDLAVLPFLGETVGAASGWAGRMLTKIRSMAERLPENGDAQFYWARALLHQTPERIPEALVLLERAAKLDPKGTRSWLELGRLSSGKAAIVAFESALVRDKDLAMAHYRLAGLYRAVGNLVKSGEHLQKYQQVRSKRSEPMR